MKTSPPRLSRREQEIMEVLYRLGGVSVAEVRAHLATPPSYSAVRATLATLEKKDHVRHEFDGKRYLYLPTVRREKARISALEHLVATFFDGSATAVVSALLDRHNQLSPRELEELSRLIKQAREDGR